MKAADPANRQFSLFSNQSADEALAEAERSSPPQGNTAATSLMLTKAAITACKRWTSTNQCLCWRSAFSISVITANQ